jgi:phage-related tail protein
MSTSDGLQSIIQNVTNRITHGINSSTHGITNSINSIDSIGCPTSDVAQRVMREAARHARGVSKVRQL